MNIKQQLEQVIGNFRDIAADLASIGRTAFSNAVSRETANLSAIVEQRSVEPDKGPWTPSDDGRHIQSEDFEHDVTLRVSGDFATDEDRIAYTKWLAAKLNAAPQVPDGMVLVPEVLLRQISKWLAESADPYDKAAYAINGLIAAAKEEGSAS